MWRWCLAPLLPSYLHIFCRLSGKVRTVCFKIRTGIGDRSILKFRIILASIRDKGGCPCPRCLVVKGKIRRLGQSDDRQQRKTSLRLDNNQRRSQISSARRAIYELNYRVNSAAVERMLKEQSLVPTNVGFKIFLNFLNFNIVFVRMPSQKD